MFIKIFVIVLCVILESEIILMEELDEEFYKEIFDDVDADAILDNDRILDYYLNCFYSEGPCSELAEKMKKAIPELLDSTCGKCTPKQKTLFRHSLNKFIPKRPKDWEKLLSIYDPEGIYLPKLQAFIDKEPNA